LHSLSPDQRSKGCRKDSSPGIGIIKIWLNFSFSEKTGGENGPFVRN